MRHPGKPYWILPGLLLFVFYPLFARPPISLLLAGDTISGVVPAKPGGRWVGLYRSGGQTELRATQVRIEKVDAVLKNAAPGHPLRQHVVLEEGGGEELSFQAEDGTYLLRNTVVAIVRNGRSIWPVAGHAMDRDTLRPIPKSQVPLWLFRGLDDVSEGPITTSFYIDEYGQPLVGESAKPVVLLRLGARSYRFRAVMGRDYDWTFVLDHAGISQALAPQRGYGDNLPYLLWAGDLDRDGELDLILDLPEGDCGGAHHLFLSSRAPSDKLVKDVAQFVIPGC